MEQQIFGSKKYNDFGNTFINSVYNLAFGKSLDLPNDKAFFFDRTGNIVKAFVNKVRNIRETFSTIFSLQPSLASGGLHLKLETEMLGKIGEDCNRGNSDKQ